MTKKDYELIADVIKNCYEAETKMLLKSGIQIYSLAMIMSDTLASKNARFDRQKFLTACGVEVEQNCAYCNKEGSHFHSIDMILSGNLRK